MNPSNDTTEKKKILIVEDDRDIRESMAELLQLEGFDVECAANGAEGISKLQTAAKPHLILLDLMMPIKDGYQFREEQLSDLTISDIPVVVVTAAKQMDNRKLKLRAKDYLTKPIDVKNLLETIKRCSL